MVKRKAVASKPLFSKVKTSPFVANPSTSFPASLGANSSGPNPAQSGIFGVIGWVRSMYFAPFSAVS